MSTYRFIISGGGTGGHIFPAISIANELKARYPGCDILFVGALGRMEMERVPQAGYPIEGLPVQGFDRKRLWRNFKVLVNLVRSTRRARRIVRDFRPHVAIGVGGYASAPHAEGGRRARRALPAAGAELLRRGHQPAAGLQGRPHLRGLRGHGAVLPEGQNRAHGQPRAARPLPHRPRAPRSLRIFRPRPRQARAARGGRQPRGAHPQPQRHGASGRAGAVGRAGRVADGQVLHRRGTPGRRAPRPPRAGGDGLRGPHGLRLRRGRPRGVARRGGVHLRAVPAGQAGHPRALAQRGRRPPDERTPRHSCATTRR